MRPVKRGASPQANDFDPYDEAKPHLVSRLGHYCSYCERRVVTQLEVEHIQPKKGQYGHPQLIGRWNNFLLACRNCNATKRDKNVILAKVLLPDRDNTLACFTYQPDGTVRPATGLTPTQMAMASDTLALTGLDKPISLVLDENGKQVALDRVAQRMETWAIAEEAKADVNANPGNQTVRRLAVATAKGHGFFSIWMTVFIDDLDMRNRLIDAFEGTRGSGCFDPESTQYICPAPNPDNLADGAKV